MTKLTNCTQNDLELAEVLLTELFQKARDYDAISKHSLRIEDLELKSDKESDPDPILVNHTAAAILKGYGFSKEICVDAVKKMTRRYMPKGYRSKAVISQAYDSWRECGLTTLANMVRDAKVVA